MSVESSLRDSSRLCSITLNAFGVEIGEGIGVCFFFTLGIMEYLSPIHFPIYCSENISEEQEM
jgi:hypothetical protein